MPRPDLNLLVTLDVLLTEGSVAGAARRLRLSPSAMSRTLARLRAATGDALLVRAGRALVPTPRALELRARVGPLVQEGEALLRPGTAPDLRQLQRQFTLRTREGFVETFGPALLARIAAEAPGVRLRFIAKHDKDSALLRSGVVDLDTGVVDGTAGPEVRTQALFSERFVGVVAPGHGLAAQPATPERYAACRHVHVARRAAAAGPVDEALRALGLARDIATTVDSFSAALALARAAGLVATVPERHTAGLRAGLQTIALPLALPPMAIALLWHPQAHADPAHRWLRACVREVCAGVVGGD
ncbi:MAG: LysR family transcriptional regulator [Variovorax paradoxus]|nr:MAG: LysR family transcriptional regulator [Variovorax paradoxus]PZQ01266.1 MAG: LysR family transcriptional regulator [Variovorax paradoxus]